MSDQFNRLFSPSTLDRRTMMQGAAAGAMLFAPGLALARSGDLPAIQAAAEAGYDAAVARLQDWIRNPSIAAESFKMQEGADYMMRLVKDAGFQTAEVIQTDGHPGVFATLDVGAPRWMGIYFMYDVKQFDPAEWSSPPLEARLLDREGFGKIVMGRGAVNQKGPETAFLNALHALRAAGKKPPVNIVLVAEGEEEIGSPHFRQIVTHKKALPLLRKCLGVIIPGALQSPSGSVAINLGAKGVIECEIVASGEKWGRGPLKDIHSSQKARVDSPAWRLVQALQTLVTPDGNTPAIEGWFEKVRPLTAREKQLIAETAAATSEEDAMRAMGVTRWIDDLDWRASIERLVSQPTVNIEGLVGGYTGPGGKTILPAKATAKLDLRLVPDMTAEDSLAKLKAHLAKKGFADVEVTMTGGYDPTETAEDSPLIRAEQATLANAGIPYTLYPRIAGSWPGCIFTGAPVSRPASLFGVGYGAGAHAPDEFFVVESANPKIAGLIGATMGHVDFLYQAAAVT